jgi:hypothetical protein
VSEGRVPPTPTTTGDSVVGEARPEGESGNGNGNGNGQKATGTSTVMMLYFAVVIGSSM